MICPFCYKTCKSHELQDQYTNVVSHYCDCTSDDSMKNNFSCLTYKANNEIHEFYIHLTHTHLWYGTRNMQYNIYTVSPTGQISYIFIGNDLLSPSQALDKLEKYEKLIWFS